MSCLVNFVCLGSLRQRMTVVRRLMAAVAAILWLAPTAVSAGTGGGNISNFHVLPDGRVVFYTSSTHNNAPPCATNTGRFAFNGATAAGRLQAAAVLTAFSTNKSLVIYGTGECSHLGDTESVDWFYIP